MLGATGRVQLAYGALLTLGLGARVDRQSAISRGRGRRLFGVGGVAGAWDRGERRHVGILAAIRSPIAVNLASCSPASTSTGHAARHASSLPERSLRAGTRQTEARCQPVRRVAEAVPAVGGGRRRGRANIGCASHSSTNALDCRSRSSAVSLATRRRRCARRAPRRRRCPACPADEHQPLDLRRARAGRRAVRGGRPSSNRRTCRAGERRRVGGGLLDREPVGGAETVAGQVDEHERRLSESVRADQRGAQACQ